MRCTSQKNVLNIPRWGEWQHMSWLIPPIANSAAGARARPCRPGRAGVSVAGPGYCQTRTVPVSVAREVQLKRRKMPFSDWAISWDDMFKKDFILKTICLKQNQSWAWRVTFPWRGFFFLGGWRATFHGRWSSIPLIRLEYRKLCSVHQVLLFPSIYSHFNRNWWILICSMQVLCHD